MEKFEKLDNDQKELVRYWILKCRDGKTRVNDFIEKHLTPEPVIDVGKWYTGCGRPLLFKSKQSLNEDFLGFITQINKCDIKRSEFEYYGFNNGGIWKDKDYYSLEYDIREATREEVTERLLKEATSIGYKDGNCKCLYMPNSNNLVANDFYVEWTERDGVLVWKGNDEDCILVFEKGKWAEIIDDKSELKATIAKLRSELSTLEAQL